MCPSFTYYSCIPLFPLSLFLSPVTVLGRLLQCQRLRESGGRRHVAADRDVNGARRQPGVGEPGLAR